MLIAWPALVLRESTVAPLDAAAIERVLEIFAPPAAEQPDPMQMLVESMRGTR